MIKRTLISILFGLSLLSGCVARDEVSQINPSKTSQEILKEELIEKEFKIWRGKNNHIPAYIYFSLDSLKEVPLNYILPLIKGSNLHPSKILELYQLGIPVEDILGLYDLRNDSGEKYFDKSFDFGFFSISDIYSSGLRLPDLKSLIQIKDKMGRQMFTSSADFMNLNSKNFNLEEIISLIELSYNNGQSIYETGRDVGYSISENVDLKFVLDIYKKYRDYDDEPVFNGLDIVGLKDVENLAAFDSFYQKIIKYVDDKGKRLFLGSNIITFFEKSLEGENIFTKINSSLNLVRDDGKRVLASNNSLNTVLVNNKVDVISMFKDYMNLKDSFGDYLFNFDSWLEYVNNYERYSLKLTDLIEFNDTNKPNAIYFLPAYDWNGAFKTSGKVNFISELKKHYDVKFKIISKDSEISETIKRIPNIELLVLSGHGQSDSIQFGQNLAYPYYSFYNTNDEILSLDDVIDLSSFSNLNPTARIFLYSCSTAADLNGKNNIAKTISLWAGNRKLYAPRKPFSPDEVKVRIFYPFDVDFLDTENHMSFLKVFN